MVLDTFFKMKNDSSFIDMMGRKVQSPINPKRIISLVPSLTELLYDLKLEEECNRDY